MARKEKHETWTYKEEKIVLKYSAKKASKILQRSLISIINKRRRLVIDGQIPKDYTPRIRLKIEDKIRLEKKLAKLDKRLKKLKVK